MSDRSVTKIAPAIWLLMATGGILCAAGAAEPTAAQRSLERTFQKLAEATPQVSAREVMGFCFDSASDNYHAERIGSALAVLQRMHDADRGSKTFGNLRWKFTDARVFDPNAVEFVVQQAVLIGRLYDERLDADGRRRLRSFLELAIEGVTRHRVPIAYTNIYLMKSWNLVALGETLGRRELADEGYQMLDSWLAHARSCGIDEYLSPTYYATDLDSLSLLARYSQRAEGRSQAATALRYVWTDIAANWYAPGQRLGGAHSRDYDYLTGGGELDDYLQQAGWLDNPKLTPSAFRRLTFSPPPDQARQLSGQLPRFVQQRWGSERWQTASHYLGRSFSIGSAGASYHNMDKPLVVNLPSGRKQPQLYFVMDGRGDPYGKQKVVTGGTHLKSLHLKPLLTSVQRDAEVLLLAADDAQTRKEAKVDELTCLLSHVVLPTDAELWRVDSRWRPTSSTEAAHGWPAVDPLFIRQGDVAVGIRSVVALDNSGKPAPWSLVDDGQQYLVRRFTCTHNAKSAEGAALLALWVRVAEGLDDISFAKFRRDFAAAKATVDQRNAQITVTATGLAGELSVGLDLEQHQRLAWRGAPDAIEHQTLSVNGRDLAAEILGANPESSK